MQTNMMIQGRSISPATTHADAASCGMTGHGPLGQTGHGRPCRI
jgi:hypothetical protein